jgi:putative PIN family toxin of toxin-antitoxin system
MKVVIDTNVFVSSVFGGPPRKVVERWFAGQITLCISEDIFKEYQRVLRDIKAVSPQEERDLIRAFTSGQNILYVTDPPSVNVVKEDPDDNKFLACAIALEAEHVISGDSHLLTLESYMGIRIVSPRSFMDIIDQATDQ